MSLHMLKVLMIKSYGFLEFIAGKHFILASDIILVLYMSRRIVIFVIFIYGEIYIN